MSKTWFITGASRGLGLHLARAVLAAGDRVVASARDRDAVATALGSDHEALLSLTLDVADAGRASAAVHEAVTRFGSIDVLVNNAGYGHLGFFEETSDQDVEEQFSTNLFGVLAVTRAVLPVMRAARRGHIFNVSSLAGLVGAELGSLYCASKFALEGFSEALAKELLPFGIRLTIVEPGPFRTDFLTPQSLRFAAREVADYDARRAQLRASFEQRNGLQPGDPARLAAAIVQLAATPEPPLRFVAGGIALDAADAKLEAVRLERDRWRSLSLATDAQGLA